MINNNNEVMAENPNQWVKEVFKDWMILGKPKSIADFTPEQKRQDELWKEPAKRDLCVTTMASTTTTTTTKTKTKQPHLLQLVRILYQTK